MQIIVVSKSGKQTGADARLLWVYFPRVQIEYERAIAQINKRMLPTVESVFLLTTPEHTPVNSTIIRDIIRNKGDASLFLPKGIDIKDYL